MKFVFRNDTVCNGLRFIVSDTWMCLERGEGEEPGGVRAPVGDARPGVGVVREEGRGDVVGVGQS